MRTPEELEKQEQKIAWEGKLYGFLFGAAPGIAGALASGYFVNKNTWTSRAVGFVVGEVVVFGSLAFAGCGYVNLDKPAGYCLINVPMEAPSLIWEYINLK
jgi:hypothetical protein